MPTEARRGQQNPRNWSNLQLTAIMWLDTELWSSASSVNALNHRAISPAHCLLFLKSH